MFFEEIPSRPSTYKLSRTKISLAGCKVSPFEVGKNQALELATGTGVKMHLFGAENQAQKKELGWVLDANTYFLKSIMT